MIRRGESPAQLRAAAPALAKVRGHEFSYTLQLPPNWTTKTGADVIKHTSEERIQLHSKLLAGDDVTLFTQGGCHVFALALHDRFKYPVHYIPGQPGISHIT